jgi:hypothetical protein
MEAQVPDLTEPT